MSLPRIVPAAAAVFLIVAITGTVRRQHSTVLEQAERSFTSTEMPMDITGSDCGSIASWFRGRLEFPVHAPALGSGATCQGGRLVNVGERPAAYLVYRVSDGHRVTFLVFDPRDQAFDRASVAWSTAARSISAPGPGISTVGVPRPWPRLCRHG